MAQGSLGWPRFVWEWGTTSHERALTQPCDRFLPDAQQVLDRAVDVAAPASTAFRWLCQLRVAPYSYDWIDNLGRQSPQELTPGLERLEPGQRFMTIFELVEFERGRSITLWSCGRLFGAVAITYVVEELGSTASRLLARLRVSYPDGVLTPVFRAALPPGDWVMMRRQFLNLKALAERG